MPRFFRLLWHSSLGVVGAIALTGWGLLTQQASSQITHAPESQPSTVLTISDSGDISTLAAHLKKVGAKMYGAYWCPHCAHQKEIFGDAFRDIDYVECDPRGENPRPNLCKKAAIKGYPTWVIQGKSYEGVQSLEELAKASSYKGAKNFY